MDSPAVPVAGEDTRDYRYAALSGLFHRRRLSPTQRRIARHIIDHPREAPFLSSVELARHVGVSQPSVTRLAAALGYKKYGDLQREMRRLVLGPAGDDKSEGGNKFQDAVAAEISNLEALERYVADPGLLLSVGRHLAASEPLCVLGLRASAPVAGYFGYFASKVHPDVWTLTRGGSTVFDQLAHARQAGGEWILCFVLPRHPRETLEAMAHAKSLGFRLITVTDRGSESIAGLSEIFFAAEVGTRLVFDSPASATVLAGILLEALSDAYPARTQTRLEEFEQRATSMEWFDRE